MKESSRLKEIFKVKPEVIYNAWLNSETHTKMTGGEAVCEPKQGSKFSAWDGYIFGKNIELVKNQKIVQSWRTTEFNEADEDSILEIRLNELESGTELTLIHTNIPEGETQYEKGWVEHYFEPMKAFFNI
jgi:activator of HSP90 ATPase